MSISIIVISISIMIIKIIYYQHHQPFQIRIGIIERLMLPILKTILTKNEAALTKLCPMYLVVWTGKRIDCLPVVGIVPFIYSSITSSVPFFIIIIIYYSIISPYFQNILLYISLNIFI